MPDRFTQFLFYVSYWLDAVDEHSLHSPFFYDFYSKAVKKNGRPNPRFEKLRYQLEQNKRALHFQDPGSGSVPSRTIGEIARASLSPFRYSRLYANIAEHFNARQILELGTSFGINALYLAERKEAQVTTLEGAPAIAEIAADTFAFADAKNINLVTGNIDRTLGDILQSVRQLDLVLMDANHRYAPTLSYFEKMLPRLKEKSIVIVDDIHYSREMEQAWRALKNHRIVYGSADLYRCGILFFDPSLNKQHVILQY